MEELLHAQPGQDLRDEVQLPLRNTAAQDDDVVLFQHPGQFLRQRLADVRQVVPRSRYRQAPQQGLDLEEVGAADLVGQRRGGNRDQFVPRSDDRDFGFHGHLHLRVTAGGQHPHFRQADDPAGFRQRRPRRGVLPQRVDVLPLLYSLGYEEGLPHPFQVLVADDGGSALRQGRPGHDLYALRRVG